MCCGSGKAGSPRSNRSNAPVGGGITDLPIWRLLGGIKKLLHEDGMTIRGVQKILREQGCQTCRFAVARARPDEMRRRRRWHGSAWTELPRRPWMTPPEDGQSQRTSVEEMPRPFEAPTQPTLSRPPAPRKADRRGRQTGARSEDVGCRQNRPRSTEAPSSRRPARRPAPADVARRGSRIRARDTVAKRRRLTQAQPRQRRPETRRPPARPAATLQADRTFAPPDGPRHAPPPLAPAIKPADICHICAAGRSERASPMAAHRRQASDRATFGS